VHCAGIDKKKALIVGALAWGYIRLLGLSFVAVQILATLLLAAVCYGLGKFPWSFIYTLLFPDTGDPASIVILRPVP